MCCKSVETSKTKYECSICCFLWFYILKYLENKLRANIFLNSVVDLHNTDIEIKTGKIKPKGGACIITARLVIFPLHCTSNALVAFVLVDLTLAAFK